MSDEKKLHVDEDWKTQVDREKEQLREQNESSPTSSATSPASTANSSNASKKSVDASANNRDLPPASLIILISSLATQAMASMGQLPNPDGNAPPVDLPFARHFIDLIGVIEDKTRNNLTAEEASFLNNTLLHLRMLFVESSRR